MYTFPLRSRLYRRPPLLERPPPLLPLERPPLLPLLKLPLLEERPLLLDETELERVLVLGDAELLRTDEPVERPLLLLLTDDERVGVVDVAVERRVVVVLPLFTVAELLRVVLLPVELIFDRFVEREVVRLLVAASALLRRDSVLNEVLRPVVVRVVALDERADELRAPTVVRRESDDDERYAELLAAVARPPELR
jgi:hypothetical protein